MIKAIKGKVTFLIRAVTGDFGDILGFLFLSLAFATCGQSNISSSCGKVKLLTLSLMIFFFLFFSGLFRGFLGFRALFDLVDLILVMFVENCTRFLLSLFRLIVGVDTYFQTSFFLGTPPVQVGISMNTSFGLGPIGFAN